GAGGHHLACAAARIDTSICPGDGPKAHHALRLKPDHPMGSGHHPRPEGEAAGDLGKGCEKKDEDGFHAAGSGLYRRNGLAWTVARAYRQEMPARHEAGRATGFMTRRLQLIDWRWSVTKRTRPAPC